MTRKLCLPTFSFKGVELVFDIFLVLGGREVRFVMELV